MCVLRRLLQHKLFFPDSSVFQHSIHLTMTLFLIFIYSLYFYAKYFVQISYMLYLIATDKG